MSKMVDLPAIPDFWKTSIESGKKTCLTWIRIIGVKGQYFILWGKVYIILWVEERDMESVANNLFLQEGCNSPEEFIETWIRLYPRTLWRFKRRVFVHHFMLLEEWERNYGR